MSSSFAPIFSSINSDQALRGSLRVQNYSQEWKLPVVYPTREGTGQLTEIALPNFQKYSGPQMLRFLIVL